MKTFIFSIPARLRSFNEKLDVKGALCGKSWEVFNDEGVKQLFIFNTDGTLLITTNGKVLMSSWQFIPANTSVIITAENETTMFHPAFYANTIFALQQDGVERYLFMIDEQNKAVFPEITLRALNVYFEEKERKIVEDAEREKLLRQEVLLSDEKEQERSRLLEYEEISQFIIDNKEQLNRSFRNRRLFASLASIIGSLLLSWFIISNVVLSNNYYDLGENTSFWIVCLIIGVSLLSIGLIVLLQDTGTYLKVVIENKLGYNIVYHSTDEIKQLYEEL